VYVYTSNSFNWWPACTTERKNVSNLALEGCQPSVAIRENGIFSFETEYNSFYHLRYFGDEHKRLYWRVSVFVPPLYIYSLFKMRSDLGGDQFSFARVRHICPHYCDASDRAAEQSHAHAHNSATEVRSHFEQSIVDDGWRCKFLIPIGTSSTYICILCENLVPLLNTR